MANKPALRIAFVLDDSLDKADGVQQYVLGLGRWLGDQGHDIIYLVGQSTRSDIAGIHSLSRNVNVRFNHNRMSMPLPAKRATIRALVLAHPLDIVHVQIPYSPWLAHRVIAELPSDTVVFGTFHVVAHSNMVSTATRLLARWTRSSLKRFDQIVSVSSAAQDYAAKTYDISTTILPNVVDYQRFKSAQPRPEYNNQVITILFLGRLVERKGALWLLRAVVLLDRNRLPAFRVVICGTGPLLDQLERYVRLNNLAVVVSFVGYVSERDKPSYYASADIAVFPSTGGESFGIVLLEAMAAGRAAVLAGNNVGYATVLAPQPELLFNPNDSQALAEKLESYLIDRTLRMRMAVWGAGYSRNFDTEHVGKQLVKDYRQALRKRRHL
jgi:phosphatidylinositol alpha-mannosyltransferase